jgi:hypothetical protein
MGDLVRIAPPLTDDDVVEWVGYDGANTQAVARRFAWAVSDARKRLERLQAQGRLASDLRGLRFGEAESGGRHRVWHRL